jgi:hypothetical protein
MRSYSGFLDLLIQCIVGLNLVYGSHYCGVFPGGLAVGLAAVGKELLFELHVRHCQPDPLSGCEDIPLRSVPDPAYGHGHRLGR